MKTGVISFAGFAIILLAASGCAMRMYPENANYERAAWHAEQAQRSMAAFDAIGQNPNPAPVAPMSPMHVPTTKTCRSTDMGWGNTQVTCY